MTLAVLTTIDSVDDCYYKVQRAEGDGMNLLRLLFPDGKANDMNMVLFSTSGVHGSYLSIEQVERNVRQQTQEDDDYKVTFLVLHPRIVSMKYGNCRPRSPEDFQFLKDLRATSIAALSMIGRP